MKKTKFTDEQIAFALRQAETESRVKEVCRKMGISEVTFYNWKKKQGGLEVSELRRLKQLIKSAYVGAVLSCAWVIKLFYYKPTRKADSALRLHIQDIAET
ncbi:Transposase [Halodesulfovibrio marinisediminis DSM 17456]|uniref:Transposase n=1 Tax=Halodesulfovibrio marinisediminis DSM 17456 TaxID=1121457 RepID=A0A1N6FT70_9BACT|nr:Transposase [Halodesulfovibrio marinisediminis DSM 17456]